MSPIVLVIIGVVVVLGGILLVKLHPILALLLGALIVGILTPDSLLEGFAVSKGMSTTQTNALLNQSLGKRVALGFGDTCEKVGMLIVLASIIGKCLLDSGAAERIVRSMLRIFGEKKAPVAYMVSSFALGIPIFFDTVFYLMIPLARAMGIRTPKSYALYVMMIIAGATMTHSLVPPTPGPLFAAGALGVSIGTMIIMGSIVGLACSTMGWIYGTWLNSRQNIPLRPTADISIEGLQAWLEKDTSQLPSFFLSNLPIIIPVILISGQTIIEAVHPALPEWVLATFSLTGDPIIALFIATTVALYLLARQYAFKLKELKKPIEEAIYSAGTIILITSTGGAFGAMLQQTNIGSWLTGIAPDYKLAVLPLAFFITAVIRSAQGSATVAMITAVGMLTVFNAPGALSFHPVYLAIVIGCGSKIFPWMNDSGFWIVCKMSGFTEGETIRNFSFLLVVMGLTGLIFTMILAKLFPLI
ncbi:MAG TPA: SLC13 family permease [Cyclobacteriaceae bacterium]|nr:SLC13 family permease [Cyclobacteriaceae bacterium]